MVTGKHKLKYRCVEIISGARACAAAKALRDTKLLSAEAPLLPLKTCDTPADCKCTYRHFADRRQGPRRENEHAFLLATAYTAAERRKKRGRRESDYN